MFYVDSTGRHGLVSMFNDAAPGNIFPRGDDNAPTGAANNFGGMTNTLLIVPIEIATNPSLNFAAGQCTQLALNQVGGNCESSVTISCYADYYLPAVNELIWLTNFSNTTSPTSPTSQYWTALSGIYWSSTEYGMSTAYTVNVTNSSPMVQDKQTNNNTVRCIRAF